MQEWDGLHGWMGAFGDTCRFNKGCWTDDGYSQSLGVKCRCGAKTLLLLSRPKRLVPCAKNDALIAPVLRCKMGICMYLGRQQSIACLVCLYVEEYLDRQAYAI